MVRIGEPSEDTLTANTSYSGIDSEMFNYPPRKWAPVSKINVSPVTLPHIPFFSPDSLIVHSYLHTPLYSVFSVVPAVF